MESFMDEMISTGRFSNRSQVTKFALQHLMKSEGYSLLSAKENVDDPIIERTQSNIRRLVSRMEAGEITQSSYYHQVTRIYEWLGKSYDALASLTQDDFVDICEREELQQLIGTKR